MCFMLNFYFPSTYSCFSLTKLLVSTKQNLQKHLHKFSPSENGRKCRIFEWTENKGSLLQLCGTSTTASSSADTSVGPASVMVGNLVQGNRLAAAQGRDLGFTDDNKVKEFKYFWNFFSTTLNIFHSINW